MNKDFLVEICSDLDYEELVADISYKNSTVAMITQEHGEEKMEVEIFTPPEQMESWKFFLNDFVEAVMFAKEKLIEMKKLPDD